MLFSTIAKSQAILNAEKLSPQRKEPFQFQLTGDFSIASGNTNFINIETTGAIGYKKSQHWLRLLGGNAFLTEEENQLENSHFGHLRYNYFWQPRLSSFHFIQFQRNANLILNFREIAGSGLRYHLLQSDSGFNLIMGSGIMYEDEQLQAGKLEPNESQRTQHFRSTSMLVIAHQFSPQFILKNITYFQPRLQWLNDFRLLNELDFVVAVNESVNLELAFEWRYDNLPPGQLERNDYGLEMGLNINL